MLPAKKKNDNKSYSRLTMVPPASAFICFCFCCLLWLLFLVVCFCLFCFCAFSVIFLSKVYCTCCLFVSQFDEFHQKVVPTKSINKSVEKGRKVNTNTHTHTHKSICICKYLYHTQPVLRLLIRTVPQQPLFNEHVWGTQISTRSGKQCCWLFFPLIIFLCVV